MKTILLVCLLLVNSAAAQLLIPDPLFMKPRGQAGVSIREIHHTVLGEECCTIRVDTYKDKVMWMSAGLQSPVPCMKLYGLPVVVRGNRTPRWVNVEMTPVKGTYDAFGYERPAYEVTIPMRFFKHVSMQSSYFWMVGARSVHLARIF